MLNTVADRQKVNHFAVQFPARLQPSPCKLCGQATAQGGEEESKLQLKLEYMSGLATPEGVDSRLGRRLLLPIQLRILPSLQV